MTEEEWREIPGYQGYEASDLGNIRSWHGRNGKARAVVPRALKPDVLRTSYLQATFRVDRVPRRMLVHRAVLLAFVGPCPLGQETRHLNGVRTDNRLENLCYGTRKENCADRAKHDTSHCQAGERNPQAKLCDESVRAIRSEYASGGVSQAELGRRHGVGQHAICAIVSGGGWKYVH